MSNSVIVTGQTVTATTSLEILRRRNCKTSYQVK